MKKRICEMTVEELIQPGAHTYKDCGLHYYAVGKGVVSKVPEALSVIGCRRPFVVMDKNTLEAGGRRVMSILDNAGISFSSFVFPFDGHIEPDEKAVGSLTMAFDPACDILLAVGSGVINDCCKVVAHAAGKPSMVVGTAPSMDGYASNSGSMIQNRVKVSLYNACPQAIIGDTDILKTAPDIMLKAGIGDMLAKYVALCEWRIAAMVHGDAYDEEIAEMVRRALARIVALSDKLLARDDEAIAAVFDGLVLSGLSMGLADESSPASGSEHVMSHLIDMASKVRHTGICYHGTQVAVSGINSCIIWDWLLNEFDPKAVDLDKCYPTAEEMEPRVRAAFDWLDDTHAAANECWSDYQKKLAKWHANREKFADFLAHFDEFKATVAPWVKKPEYIADCMHKAKAPCRYSVLNFPVDAKTATWAMNNCHLMRNRFSVIDLLFYTGIWNEDFVQKIIARADSMDAGL